MDLPNISLTPLQGKKVAIIGYGNQGRAHALNLRDSGIEVVVGARAGRGEAQARLDGFVPVSAEEAASQSDVVMFLLPDQTIPKVYAELEVQMAKGRKTIGFAHGFAVKFKLIRLRSECGYFLVGPKGAGAILRARYESGEGLPGIFAVLPRDSRETRAICLAYAKAVGLAHSYLGETSFEEETESDLFGEQSVLCGGILQLMEGGYETMVRNGISPEMAFFECCFEARMILELWMKYGPKGLSERISPTAFYGGLTRGRRLVTDETRREMEEIFQEVRGGEFAREWLGEVRAGMPQLERERERLAQSSLQATYDKLRPSLVKD